MSFYDKIKLEQSLSLNQTEKNGIDNLSAGIQDGRLPPPMQKTGQMFLIPQLRMALQANQNDKQLRMTNSMTPGPLNSINTLSKYTSNSNPKVYAENLGIQPHPNTNISQIGYIDSSKSDQGHLQRSNLGLSTSVNRKSSMCEPKTPGSYKPQSLIEQKSPKCEIVFNDTNNPIYKSQETAFSLGAP